MWQLSLLAAVAGIEIAVPPDAEVSPVIFVQRQVILGILRPTPSLVAYYINTDAEVGRRRNMEAQAERAHMELSRFKAVDLSRVNSGEFHEKYVKKQNLSKELVAPERQKDHLPNATVACYVSHSELLEKLHRELAPHQLGLVLEDDVEIPSNWNELVNATLSCAPSDWSLLKVSGWGYSRASDLQQHRSSNESCPDAYLMKRPFKETSWWHFWGPVFRYAGTGAYLVKVSSIPEILAHLRQQPIDDIDGMLLSEGNLRAYELWPHIFPLNADHMKSTMKSSRNSTGLLDALSSILRDDETTESNSSVEKGQQLMRSMP